jgi:hypothetical protein
MLQRKLGEAAGSRRSLRLRGFVWAMMWAMDYEFTYYDSVIFRSPGEDGCLFDRYLRGRWVPALGELFPSEEELNRMRTIPEHLARAMMHLPFPEKEAAVRRWGFLTRDDGLAQRCSS